MKKLLITIVTLTMLFIACEKEEEGPEQCWHCNEFTRMWQTETDLFTGEVIRREQIWWPKDETTTYCEGDGYDQEYIERRIEMHSEKKKITCYP